MSTDNNSPESVNAAASFESENKNEQPAVSENSLRNQEHPKQRILIGSQRNPEAYRSLTTQGDEKSPSPIATYDAINRNPSSSEKTNSPASEQDNSLASDVSENQNQADSSAKSGRPERRFDRSDAERSPSGRLESERPGNRERGTGERGQNREKGRGNRRFNNEPAHKMFMPVAHTVPVPNRHDVLGDDLEAELAELFQNENSMDSIMESADSVASTNALETESKVKGKVISIQRDSVFIDLGSRDQGIIPLKQFPEGTMPDVGTVLDAIVTRFNRDEGLYELMLPGAAADVGDWSSVEEGMTVEARITAVNNGGLECEVGKLRGFIPMGQIAIYRVEKPEEFIGEKLNCLITEVNPERRNLVLSRRSILEQEREEKRQALLAELEPGQTREGLVRKIIDVGAFVDLGGVDGFIHISAMSWGRIRHPSDVLKEGDRVQVTVLNIDEAKNRISLSFKDASLDPWKSIFDKFQEGAEVRGQVRSIMDFGAFVELLPGVDGLVHISELAHHRVANVNEVVKIGDWVQVKILSIDEEKRKISLSMKQLIPDPRIEEQKRLEAERSQAEADRLQAEADAEAAANAEAESVRAKLKPFKGELQGGVTRNSDGSHFGLKW